MNKSLYSKIVLILVVFIITVMCVVGVVILNNTYTYYSGDFSSTMKENFSQGSPLYLSLQESIDGENYVQRQKETLLSYSGLLGIDESRNYFILDMNGNFLEGSDASLGKSLDKTPNIISAMGGESSGKQLSGVDYLDFATVIRGETTSCIIYVKDTQEDTRDLSWILFTIILQSLLIGLIIAIIMAFFLSKAITAPIQNLTKGAQLVASGNFEYNIETHSNDEIGVLTGTFNHMRRMLKNTIAEVSGEREKLETVFSQLQAGVITFSDTGKVLNINNFALELLGDKYNEKFDLTTLLSIFDIRSDSPTGDALSDENGEDGNIIFDEVVFNGKVIEVNFGGIRYSDKGNMSDGVITVIHDVTSRYELDRARREFVANVSHELRTPLTSIKGSCETILQHPELPEDIKIKFLEMIDSESTRMTGIVKDLLTLSRLDNKRTKWQISEYNLNESLSHLCHVMTVDATTHGHQLLLKTEKDLPLITADKDRIDQVIVNIISNAIKYTPDNGTIAVSTSLLPGEKVSVKVIDNGLGIPEEDLPRIFERFYRVEKARTTDTGGTGLGLAIAKELIEAHGGNIEISSKLGVGTMVEIVLPVHTKLRNEED